jgi:hypothetical protein
MTSIIDLTDENDGATNGTDANKCLTFPLNVFREMDGMHGVEGRHIVLGGHVYEEMRVDRQEVVAPRRGADLVVASAKSFNKASLGAESLGDESFVAKSLSDESLSDESLSERQVPTIKWESEVEWMDRVMTVEGLGQLDDGAWRPPRPAQWQGTQQ